MLTLEEKRAKRAAYMREYNRRRSQELGASFTTFWRAIHPEAARKHREEEKRRWRADPAVQQRHGEICAWHRRKLKIAAYEAYGGCVCACCGETTEEFLSIDHVNNDGAAHRKMIKGGGDVLYRWLRDQKYPPGFQILCMNCNFGKRINGGVCPHRQQKAATA